MKKYYILLVFLFSIFCNISWAHRLYGTITDSKKQPLPFATVYAKGTPYGTAANADGKYFLDLPKGSYTVMFRLVGYKSEIATVVIENADIQKDVSLSEESLILNEIKIVAGAEDPAIGIMRKAIAKRKDYQNQVESYSCHFYTKGNNRLLKAPKKILGREVNLPKIDSVNGTIMYLSESVSEYYWKRPNRYKEIMTAAKTSGQPNAFSWNSAAAMQTNYYDNLVKIDQLASRGFVSPVASNAMFYYRFRLLGSFEENGLQINKIELVPRRKNDPVFRGTIYIVENSWRIHSCNFFLTKEANIEYVDTLRLTQTYAPVTPDVWLPNLQMFEFNYGLLGFKGKGFFVGSASEFKVNPQQPDNFFNNEVMKIEPTANKKDSVYWDSVRVVPLTAEEKLDYHQKDSIQVIKESKQYKDSLDRVSNKFEWTDLLTGYTYQNRYKNYRITVQSPLNTVQFNAIDGWYISPEISYSRRNSETYKTWNLTQTLRYGIDSKNFYGKTELSRTYNPRKMAAFKLEAGSFLTQFNENEPVTPLATSLALWRIQYNPARFYKKTYFLADHKTELANGLLLSSRLMYARRQELSNEPSLRHYNQYDANNVISDRFQQPDAYIAMPTHNTLQLWLSLEIRFQQEYLSHPLTKYVTEESKWPIITLQYKKGIPSIFNSVSNFDFIGANARYRYDMGLLGHTDFLAEYGHFVNTKHIAFPDFKHFMGNRVLIHPAQQNSFLNLPYYAYSTANAYTEFHVAHRFKGFLLNKLPLIRKLHWHELVAVNYVSAPKSQKDAYIEWLVGVENVFKILSVEWGQSYIGGKYAGQRICFRVGFSN